jgi:hypothetical protein
MHDWMRVAGHGDMWHVSIRIAPVADREAFYDSTHDPMMQPFEESGERWAETPHSFILPAAHMHADANLDGADFSRPCDIGERPP